MAIGPGTKVSAKLTQWAAAAAFVASATFLYYSGLTDAKAQTDSVKSRHEVDQARNDLRFESDLKWKDEATEARKRLFELLYDINASVKRIEGQMDRP